MNLTIGDIREWLIENRIEYQKLKSREFPPFNNALYSMYGHLKNFIEYYRFRHKCDKALHELDAVLNLDFIELAKWTKDYEILGSEDLLMFEINYINLSVKVSKDSIRIHEGLYTERKPFAKILCFCKIFQHLYWDNNIHENTLTEKEKMLVKTKVGRILKKYYLDRN